MDPDYVEEALASFSRSDLSRRRRKLSEAAPAKTNSAEQIQYRPHAAASKAIELDDTVADAHASIGFINLVFDWNWPDAGREFRKALESNPN